MTAQSRPVLLLTRPAEASARFAAQVQQRVPGVRVVISPLMAPAFLAPGLPDGWDGVLFTSETGVAGLTRLTDRRGPAVCVGARTADAAQAAGWQAQALGGDAEGMVAGLMAAPLQGHWLHARGADAAGDLAARLRAAGMAVTEAIVYDQRPQPLSAQAHAVLAGPGPVWLAVFSPRSARLFVAEAGDIAAPVQAVAISPAAAAVLTGVCPVVVAARPDAAAMLDALGGLAGKDGGA
jgi:uroporphyrinogen-III synthase